MLVEVKQEDPLREEIAFLGEMLGDTIREIAGEECLRVVEDMRRLAWDSEEQSEELRHLLRLTINGLAAGMRTSG